MTDKQVTTTPEPSPVEKFTKMLDGSQRKEIAKQLPAGVNVDRFIRTAITVVRMNPELMTCTATSLFGAVMTAAKDGLLPDGKEALIQPYNCKVSAPNEKPERWEKQAQYMPMVKGLIQIMYRTGEVATIDGAAVYEKDVFEYERGDQPRIVHKPYLGAEQPGKIIAAYCIITMKGGEVKREVMNARDLAAVRAASKSANGPGWTKWEDQFSIKAVIKRAYKQMPSDPSIDHAFEQDNQAMQFDFDQRQETARIEHQPGKPSRLHGIIGSSKAKAEVQATDSIEATTQHDDVPFK